MSSMRQICPDKMLFNCDSVPSILENCDSMSIRKVVRWEQLVCSPG
ncbi:unnamed protein product, partial [Urochloa humidicola]